MLHVLAIPIDEIMARRKKPGTEIVDQEVNSVKLVGSVNNDLRRSKRQKAEVNYAHMMMNDFEEEEEDEEEDDDGDEVMIASDLALSPDIDKDGNIISCTDDDLDDIENKKTNSNVLSLRKRRKRMRYSYSKLARTVLKWPAGHNIISSDLYAIHSTGFRSPCVIRQSSPSTPRSLGIRLPRGKMTVKRLTKLVGVDHPVQTIDVATQSEGPVYSMEDWVSYFQSPPPRKRLLNVVSLELADTPLQSMVSIPSLVKELDLVGKVWPKNDNNRPKVQLYALMSVANCYTDFHIDFGGSSVWYHVLSGRKVFLLVPPTKGNLLMFEEWASSKNQASVFFAERVNDCQKVELLPGDTLFIPGGWPHCVSTPVDSFVIGGNFLTGYNLSLQLDIWHMEERLKIRRKFRYPLYKPLMWHTAAYYLDILKKGNICVSVWEKEGLTSLLSSLESWVEQSSAKLEIPDHIKNPKAILKDLKKELLKGKELIFFCILFLS